MRTKIPISLAYALLFSTVNSFSVSRYFHDSSTRGATTWSASRRNILEQGTLVSFNIVCAWNSLSQPSNAARGAAELDFEFYMRDLLGGNKKEGNIQSSAPPIVPPPRTLKGPLLQLMLDDKCSISCIPVQALVRQIISQQRVKDSSLDDTIQKDVDLLRTKASRSFLARAAWLEEHVSDQYYFDLTSYALWRVAAEKLPNYVDRDDFVRLVGRMLLEQLQSRGLIRTMSMPSENVSSLRDSIPAVTEILDLFKESGYCRDYKIVGSEDIKYGSRADAASRKNDSKDISSPPVFDDLDEETLTEGGTVDCIVSIYEPCTLGASLQITGEQSRFAPDFIAPTLAALWEKVGIRCSWEVFFVDPSYRPNPKDYFPNEQLFQITLSQQKS